jgi:hypothetical protein
VTPTKAACKGAPVTGGVKKPYPTFKVVAYINFLINEEIKYE